MLALITRTEEELRPGRGTFVFSTVSENVSLRNKRKRGLIEKIQIQRHEGFKKKV